MLGKLDTISIGSATRDVFVYVPRKFFTAEECVFYPGTKIEVDDLRYCTGGGATNTAVGFARLGLRAGAACVLGDDESAYQALRELRSEKVNVRNVARLDGKKTAVSVILTGFSRDRVILNYSSTTNLLHRAAIKWGRLDAKWFYISSLHGQHELLRKIVWHAKKYRAKVAFNPGERELALGMHALVEMLGRVDVLLLNKEEALRLTRHGDISRNLKELQGLGAIVVITEGVDGAHAIDSEGQVHSIKPFDVPVVDVTGAGDAFASGFVGALVKGRGVEEALMWGAADASSVVMHLGTKNILLKEREIAKFIAAHPQSGPIAKPGGQHYSKLL